MNPVATTLFYEKFVDALFSELVGTPPSHKRKISHSTGNTSRTRGFLGMNFGWSYVNETNARKSLHFHAAVHGGPSPALLADVAGYPDLEKVVNRALDSIYCAEVPIELHAVDVARKLLKCPAPKHTFYQPTITSSDGDTIAFDREAATIAMHTGFHTHAATCRKSASGKKGCRMARPAGHPVPATRLLAITAPTATLTAPEPCDAQKDEQDSLEWRCPHCTHVAYGVTNRLRRHSEAAARGTLKVAGRASGEGRRRPGRRP